MQAWPLVVLYYRSIGSGHCRAQMGRLMEVRYRELDKRISCSILTSPNHYIQSTITGIFDMFTFCTRGKPNLVPTWHKTDTLAGASGSLELEFSFC